MLVRTRSWFLILALGIVVLALAYFFCIHRHSAIYYGNAMVYTGEPQPHGKTPVSLTLQAAIYHQSIPPYYLKMRFDQAPNYPATKRLYYLASNLKTSGTPMENWKVKIVSSSVSVE